MSDLIDREDAIKEMAEYIGCDFPRQDDALDCARSVMEQIPSARSKEGMIRKLIYKLRKRRFCKLNGWFCPDCIYHDFIFEGAIFRGNRCRYPRQTEREGE